MKQLCLEMKEVESHNVHSRAAKQLIRSGKLSGGAGKRVLWTGNLSGRAGQESYGVVS